jgi:hypothetical protein
MIPSDEETVYMPNRFKDATAGATAKTNLRLRDELKKLKPLTEAELPRLLPTAEDQENLARLLAVVGSAGTENKKVAELRSNIEAFGPVVIRVLKLLMV